MKKKFLVFLLVLLSALNPNAQNIDSLKQALSTAKEDTNKIYTLYALYLNYIDSYPDSALPYLQQIYQLSKDLDFYHGTSASLTELSDLYQRLNNYKQSLIYDSIKLDLFERSKDTESIGNTLTHIGNTYSELHDLKSSLIYYQKALNIMTAFSDTAHRMLYFYAGISGIYEENNQLDSALHYAKKAYQLNPDYGYGLEKMAVAYQRLGNNDLALQFYKKSIQSALRANEREDLMNIYNGIAEVYKQRGKIDSAIIYARSALGEEGNTDPAGLLRASGILIDMYESVNKDSVLKYLKLTSTLKDTLFEQEKEKLRILENITFNEQIKNKDAEAERTRNQNNLKLMFLLAGLLAAIIIAFILVRNNRNKQKANMMLQHQKEEIIKQKDKVESALSELKSTQQQLIQSEKMASLGELTAGIAHEIQNPLNFVNNFSDVNKELLSEMKHEMKNGNLTEAESIADEVIENEEKINHHGKRADAIVKGMLQHSRSGSRQKEPADINSLCDEYLRLAYHGLRAKDKNFNAEIKIDFDTAIGSINVVPQDIGRVVLNLINNAFYAVNERSKQGVPGYAPTVIVATRRLQDRIEISVKDNGNGIPTSIKDKIFQPFFTTKPTGQGTGLGLSLAYDIVKAHGGEIKVETKESEGAEFVIQLPLKETF